MIIQCNIHTIYNTVGFSNDSAVKNPPAVQERQEMWVQSLGQEDRLEEEWLLSPVFLPEKSHGQKSLAGLSP